MNTYKFYAVLEQHTYYIVKSTIPSFVEALGQIVKMNEQYPGDNVTFIPEKDIESGLWNIYFVDKEDKMFYITDNSFNSDTEAQLFALGLNSYIPNVKIIWEKK